MPVTEFCSSGGVPPGTVTFIDGTNLLGTVILNGAGQAVLTTAALVAGSHSVTASFNGSANLAPSASPALTQLATRASTTTVLSSSLNPSTFGQSVTLSARNTPASATGYIVFFDGFSILGRVALKGGAATFTSSSLARGRHAILAVCFGDANVVGSFSTLLFQAVR